MTDPKQIQGSNAEVAEGGLNPEDAFASLDRANSRRLAEAAKDQHGPQTTSATTPTRSIENQ